MSIKGERRIDGMAFRWDCEEKDCYVKTCKPRIERIAQFLPNNREWARIRPSNIDGVIERNGHFLFIEHKSIHADDALPKGQEIMLGRLSMLPKCNVIVIDGLLKHDDGVRRIAYFNDGRMTPWREADMGDLENAIKRWVKMVENSQ